MIDIEFWYDPAIIHIIFHDPAKQHIKNPWPNEVAIAAPMAPSLATFTRNQPLTTAAVFWAGKTGFLCPEIHLIIMVLSKIAIFGGYNILYNILYDMEKNGITMYNPL